MQIFSGSLPVGSPRHHPRARIAKSWARLSPSSAEIAHVWIEATVCRVLASSGYLFLLHFSGAWPAPIQASLIPHPSLPFHAATRDVDAAIDKCRVTGYRRADTRGVSQPAMTPKERK